MILSDIDSSLLTGAEPLPEPKAIYHERKPNAKVVGESGYNSETLSWFI